MLASALEAGMMSAGAEIYSLGVFPTPGISYVLRQGGLDAGAVISASHNTAEYNGIKFFTSSGDKLNDEDEAEIENYLGDDILQDWRPTGAGIGDIHDARGRRRGYVEWLKNMASSIDAGGWPIVIDAANGAAAGIVRGVFDEWPADVSYCGIDADGLNINDGVGVMHMNHLASEVVSCSASLGIAFDGDADRALMCDSRGRTIDGDVMLWVIGRCLNARGELGNGLVATVMSNMILEEKLADAGVKVFRCPVGDRYVLEKMKESGAKLGGEQSGHVIASGHAATGDGIFAALMFLKSCRELGEDIDTLTDRFPRYPQLLKNVKTADKESVLASPLLGEAFMRAEDALKGAGRIVLRPSGTEPLIRILVEASDAELTKTVCDDMERAILRIVG
jgi:phosphoglucosamine mutase